MLARGPSSRRGSNRDLGKDQSTRMRRDISTDVMRGDDVRNNHLDPYNTNNPNLGTHINPLCGILTLSLLDTFIIISSYYNNSRLHTYNKIYVHSFKYQLPLFEKPADSTYCVQSFHIFSGFMQYSTC